MFAPRSRSKRSNALPQVRVDDQEMAAVRWMVSRLRDRDGETYSVSDVLRLAIARYYEELGGPADPTATETESGKPAASH